MTVAMDAMAVAIHIKYALGLNEHLTFYSSGSVVGLHYQICNREVSGSNLSLGYFAPRSAQPSIPPGSVNEYQLRLGMQRHVWLIAFADETQGVHLQVNYVIPWQCVI